MTAPSPTTVTLAYSVTAVGPTNIATLAAALGNVALPESDLLNIGVTISSDTTSSVGQVATRTIIGSLLPPFNASFGQSVPGGFQGSIVSSSPLDANVQAVIHYLDRNNVPKNETVNLNGTSSVNLVRTDKVTIVSVVPANAPLGSFNGLVQLFTGPKATGVIAFTEFTQGHIGGNPPQFQGSIISSSAQDTATGSGAQSVQIAYTDKNGLAHTETVVPNGQNFVNLVNNNKTIPTNISLVSVGSSGSSGGIIQLYTGLNGTGALIAYLGQSFFQFFPQKTVAAQGVNLKGNIVPLPLVQTVVGTVDMTTLVYGGGGTLDGLTLLLTFGEATAPLIVTFSAPASAAAAIQQINAVIGAVATASLTSANLLQISTNTLGPNSTINVGSGTANTACGLTMSQQPNGTVISSDLAAPFRGIYTQIIGKALASVVTEAIPVFS